MLNGTETRSPTLMNSTSGPVSTTSPVISWPSASPEGAVVRPRTMCWSLPQMSGRDDLEDGCAESCGRRSRVHLDRLELERRVVGGLDCDGSGSLVDDCLVAWYLLPFRVSPSCSLVLSGVSSASRGDLLRHRGAFAFGRRRCRLRAVLASRVPRPVDFRRAGPELVGHHSRRRRPDARADDVDPELRPWRRPPEDLVHQVRAEGAAGLTEPPVNGPMTMISTATARPMRNPAQPAGARLPLRPP